MVEEEEEERGGKMRYEHDAGGWAAASCFDISDADRQFIGRSAATSEMVSPLTGSSSAEAQRQVKWCRR